MIGQYASPKSETFQDMAALALDVSLFTSEFRLCDTISEYLADIVAQSHEDPSRYANFSSLLINEIVELAFRSAKPVGSIDFNLLRGDACVRVCVGFTHNNKSQLSWKTPNRSAPPDKHHPGHDLLVLADAIKVNVRAETDTNDRVTLIADFMLREGA
jgi:hypothetical protein